jgi:tetratricopeptide (TPR) repeat protein
LLLLHNLQYREALAYSKKGLSIDTYDPAANYYYGLANLQLGNTTDALDGFDIAALSIEYRSAAYTELSKIYFREKQFEKALDYAEKSLDFNRKNLEAYQTIAVIHRLQKNRSKQAEILGTMLGIDPLNHFARFEKYLLENTEQQKKQLVSLIRNELPHETFLELAAWYLNLQLHDDASQVLMLAPQTPEVLYWLAFLKKDSNEGKTFLQKAGAASPVLSFPFRAEAVPVLQWAIEQGGGWKPKYYLALIYWHRNDPVKANDLLKQCGNEPDFPAFYAGRANLVDENNEQEKLKDLQRAIQLDKEQWRYHKLLAEYYNRRKKYDEALSVSEPYYRAHPNDYIMGMLYAKSLLLNKRYKQSDALLTKLNIIPFEGATEGRELYREAKLMQAVEEMRKKNYKKALQFIDASKLWPVNLGVGKPYDEDIDMKLEDWMSYLAYQKSGNSRQANGALERIITARTNSPRATSVVTAWAMDKQGRKDEAMQWLNELIQKYPDNEMLSWSKAIFLHQPAANLSDARKNATVRILEQVSELR